MDRARHLERASWLLALVLLSGCASPLPYPASNRPSPAPLAGEGGAAQLWFDPSASVDAVRAITRATVSNEELPAGARAMLVLGGLSSAQLRNLARPVLPASLSSREVSSLVWAAPERREVIVGSFGASQPGGPLYIGHRLAPRSLALHGRVPRERARTPARVAPARRPPAASGGRGLVRYLRRSPRSA